MSNLKEQALLQRIGELTVGYEDRIADLRVELTERMGDIEQLQSLLTPQVQASEAHKESSPVVNITSLPDEG